MSDKLKEIIQSELIEAGITKGFQQSVENFREEQLKLDKLRDEQDELVNRFKKSSPKEKERLKKDIIALHKKVQAQQKSVDAAERKFNKALSDEPEDLELDESKLRSVKVTYDTGDTITTSMAANLSDKQIKDYFKKGKEFNIGKGGKDKLAKVKKVDILESSQLSENFTKSEVDKIKDIVKNSSGLMGLRDPLKKAGFKNIDFSFQPIPHFMIKKGRSKYVILSKKYADDPDWTIDGISGGILEGITTEGCGECGDSIVESKVELRVGKHPKKGGYTIFHNKPGFMGSKGDYIGWYKKKSDAESRKSELEKSVNESINENASKLRRDIDKEKNKLKKKWKSKGGYENFGQREVRKLRDKYNYNDLRYGSPDERSMAQQIDRFDDWAMNYTGDNESINEARTFYYNIGRGIYKSTDGSTIKDKKKEERNGYPNAEEVLSTVQKASAEVDKLNKKLKESINEADDFGIKYSKDGHVKYVPTATNKRAKEVTVDGKVYRWNPTYKTYNSVKGNELLHKNDISKAKSVLRESISESQMSPDVKKVVDTVKGFRTVEDDGVLKFISSKYAETAVGKLNDSGISASNKGSYVYIESTSSITEDVNKKLTQNISKKFGIPSNKFDVGAGYIAKKTADGNYIIVVSFDKVKNIKDPSRDFADVNWRESEKFIVLKVSKSGEILKVLDTFDNQRYINLQSYVNESLSESKLFNNLKKLKGTSYSGTKTRVEIFLDRLEEEEIFSLADDLGIYIKRYRDEPLKELYRAIVDKVFNLHESLSESKRIDKIRKIVDDRSMGRVDGTRVDLTTANAVITVYDALNPKNQKQFGDLPLNKMIDLTWKLVK